MCHFLLLQIDGKLLTVVTVANSYNWVDQVVMMLKVIIILTAIMYSSYATLVNEGIMQRNNK